MSIHFQINIEGETTDEAIAEFRKVFGALVGASVGVGAPADNQPAAIEGEVIPPAPKKTRAKKDSGPLSGGKETSLTNTPSEKSASTASQQTLAGPDATLADASDASSVSIDDLRAKLMALSKTDGGHDKVFAILGKVGAKNASTVPEDKRAEVVALVDEALAGVN